MEIITIEKEIPSILRSLSVSSSNVLGVYGYVDENLFRKVINSTKIVVGLYPIFQNKTYLFAFDYVVVSSLSEYENFSSLFPTSRMRICNKIENANLGFLTPRQKESFFFSDMDVKLKEFILCERLEIPHLYSSKKALDVYQISRNPTFNISYYSQNSFSAKKVFGWDYVVSRLNSICSSYGKIWLDTFIERSFIFDTNLLIQRGIIPYQVPWIGIAHHTFDTTHSFFNADRNFTPEWEESLKFCKGIICLSEYLSKQYREKIPNIPVKTLLHPAPLHLSKWKGWTSEKIISVGHWYRNLFSISLIPGHKQLLLKYDLAFKVSYQDYLNPLLARNGWVRYSLQHLTDHHYPLGKFSSFDLEKPCPETYPEKFLYQTLKRYLKSIEIIRFLSFQEYEEKLLTSVVFLNLCDCSASYTIIECLTRAIPIFVNRHPAVEEYLGKEYPLFYDHIENVLPDEDQIAAAHCYLMNRDLSPHCMDFFIDKLQTMVEEF